MTNTELSLEVPVHKATRDGIRREVEAWFSDKNIIPPVSYDTISAFADQLLAEKGWSRSLKAFAMVCSGNAIWRPIVGVVPYDRRILLLPHCLKNSRLCRGQMDEMGLLCGECGNCNISGFLREAENLGYVAVVTEGTAIATRLIESGKIDAVVGVGCMEVLQKMFASTSKYSIPGIGIPLLSCGCADTSVDNEWFKEELYSLSENPVFRILNLNYLRNKTASIFGEEQLKRILEPSGDLTEQLVFESILAGGKRLRPLLTLLAYEAFCEQVETTVLNRLALSIECFHKASLIHDDIEDEDEMRYGKETLHARYGIPVAINIGDLLIGEGYRLIAECNLPAETIRECIKVVANGHRLLSVGQGIELMALKNREILSLEETLKVFEYKTATAFKVSLLLGAKAGGADSDTIALLEKYSRSVGIAYQIRDDLDDFSQPDGAIELLKPSVLIAMLREQLSEADLNLFDQAQSAIRTDSLQQLIEKYEIRRKAEALLRSYLLEAKDCLATFQNIGLKMALHEILGNTFKAYL